MNNSEILDKAAQLQAFLGYPVWLNFIGLGENDGKPCILSLRQPQEAYSTLDIPDTWCDTSARLDLPNLKEKKHKSKHKSFFLRK